MDGDLHRSSRSTEQRWLEECDLLSSRSGVAYLLIFFVVRCKFACRDRSGPVGRAVLKRHPKEGESSAPSTRDRDAGQPFSKASAVVPYSPPPATALAPSHGTPAAVGAFYSPSTAAEGPRGARKGSSAELVVPLKNREEGRQRLGRPFVATPGNGSAPGAARRAEGEGFEPSIRLTTDNGFRDRRIRPLCHPSGGSYERSAERRRRDSNPRGRYSPP